MTMALTGKVAPYKIGLVPSLVRFTTHNIPMHARREQPGSVKSLERIFKADIAPDQVAAIILEPVQERAVLTSPLPISCSRCVHYAIPTVFC
jgi:4-aminobutyrate aminotransferase